VLSFLQLQHNLKSNTDQIATMKSATTFLALASIYSADAFVVQTPPRAVQPLHAESYVNGLTPPGVGTAAPAAQAPPAPFNPPKYDSPMTTTKFQAPQTTREVFEKVTPVKVQGGSLRTCSFDTAVDRVSILLSTSGRPLNANVELWQGPDNSPQKMSVYLEDGAIRPFRVIVESPGSSNAVAIRNTGQMELPLTAGIDCDMSGDAGPAEILRSNTDSRIVQGGAVFTTPFPPSVQSVQVGLTTDGRPLNARVELLQGPNNNKQVMDIYTENGEERPFYAIIETPGSGNVVRIVNTATVEFPLTASIESYMVDDGIAESSSASGGMTWS